MRGRQGIWGATAAVLVSGCMVAGIARADDAVLRMVPQADLKIFDPVWTTASITLNHAYMVYDTLFSLDSKLVPKPVMVESHTVSGDGLTYTFLLRSGLKFSDGSPVRAQDAVASVRRWAARNAAGKVLMGLTADLKTVDDRTFALTLKKPYGGVLSALADQIGPFVMREEEAKTDPAEQVRKIVGSGPFLFVESQWVPGNKVVYRRSPSYSPRSEPPDGLAGNKMAKVEQVDWIYIPDANTAANALIAGEVDILDQAPHDLIPLLKKDKNITVFLQDPLGSQAMLRPNSLNPPFNNPKARQALLHIVDQSAYIAAMVGDPAYGRVCFAPFSCGSQSESLVATEPFAKPDYEKARQLMKEAGYNGEPIVLMDPTDFAVVHNMAIVTADALRKIGVNVDLQATDWSTMTGRRPIKDPPSKNPGGYHLFHTFWPALTQANPIANAPLSTACDGSAWLGWPCDEELEKIRLSYLDAATPEQQKKVIEALQRRFFEVVPYVHHGQFFRPLAHRNTVHGMRVAINLHLWGVEKRP